MNVPVKIPPKHRISKSFGLKAQNYENFAAAQKKFQDILISDILEKKNSGIWVDLGCGTGYLFDSLKSKGCTAHCIGVDLSFQSLRILNQKKQNTVDTLLADIECLPFKSDSLSVAIFSSVLQWIDNYRQFFQNLSNTLKSGGQIFFSIFSEGSFKELNEVRSKMQLSNPVFLPTVDQILQDLKLTGFKEISQSEHEEIIYFTSARELLKSLSLIGSTAVQEKPMTRSQLHTFCSLLESTFGTEKGIPLTYRASIGRAVKG